MKFVDRYAKLNDDQKTAVDTIDGPVMVIAGPGTGKTELLSMRAANILQKTDVLPDNILCLTFTESGAMAMRERLLSIIGKDAYKVAIHTFHSFGTEIINQNREYFYNSAVFEPANDLTRYEILRTIFEKLDYKNPLASMMNGEYTHQRDATTVISELKRSGLTSDELLAVLDGAERTLDMFEHHIAPVMQKTVSAKTREALAALLPDLQPFAESDEVLFEVAPLSKYIVSSLTHTLELCETDHPTKPITIWKAKWLTKNDKGNLIFKTRAHIAKLRAVAFVYYEYLNHMEQAGLYDYDDMILQVVHAMEVHDDLRFNLQEKYLYIMVDEFQDTNLAQMRILRSLTNNPVSEGEPNLLVVGDDDQAIYSFQGADISNILQFQDLYPTRKLITLQQNYRSGRAIVEQSRNVIVQGSDRLENRFAEINKQLNAQHADAQVQIFHAPTINSERHWLVESVKQSIASGVAANDIAVLARRHNEIEQLLPYFDKAGIAVRYERQDNALDQPPIIALELVAKIVLTLSRGQHDDANGLIPELLAHPAFHLEPEQLWKLSVNAYKEGKYWLEVMQSIPQLQDTHTWLVSMAARVAHTAMEPMIDLLIGREQDNDITSPFFDYYFSQETLQTHPTQYLDCLAALRAIRTQLKEYQTKATPTLQSFIDFIAVHRRLNMTLMIKDNRGTSHDDAVQLMTAHKSKGLEFHTVYIINSVDNAWGTKARTSNRAIRYPENIPLAPAGDSNDERLRLFYVAMTRAKTQLNISYSDLNDGDKPTLIADFLSDGDTTITHIPDTDHHQTITAAELAWYEPLTEVTKELGALLEPTLQTYKLSATHLNAFIDLSRGGPQHFLLDHLLHFPSTKSPSASYGSAIHRTLQQAHIHLNAYGERKPIEDVLHDFEVNLLKERLSTDDHSTYSQKGSEQLQSFLSSNYDSFSATQKPELSFAKQEVFIDDAHVTGMIDVAEINKPDKIILVTDYKTGKPASSWSGADEREKIKLHKYRQQLMFYKLLVENSRDYSVYTVTNGCLSFIEPTKSGEIVSLDMSFDPEDMQQLKRLIAAVWKRVTQLDLPDVSGYGTSLKDIMAFEQDLIDGKI